MKIGIITDIHSNIRALNAVLEEFEKIGLDKIICCGDIIGIGPNPEAVVQKLIEQKNKLISVQGNHEQYLIKGLPEIVHNNKRRKKTTVTTKIAATCGAFSLWCAGLCCWLLSSAMPATTSAAPETAPPQ